MAERICYECGEVYDDNDIDEGEDAEVCPSCGSTDTELV